jgi:hypothetical protein
MTRTVLIAAVAFLFASCAPPGTEPPTQAAPPQPPQPSAPRASAWLQHDTTRPLPPRVEPADARLPAPAPADATVLIPADGSSLDAWESPNGSAAPWRTEGGAVVVAPGSGAIQTKQAFGDVQLHIEWKAADEPEKTNQDRSNSGVFFFGEDERYEVQILDTYENRTYADGTAGAIYGQFPPLANALRPSDQWQAYDIFFRAPRFGEDGTVEEPARLTVLQNGILVQNNERLVGRTVWLETMPYEPHGRTGKIRLQDHGSPVQFRNMWVRETPDRPAPQAGYGEYDDVDLTEADYERLTGRYDRPGGDAFVIERTDAGLGLSLPWRQGILRMVPLSPTRFQLENTAGQVSFTVDDAGNPTELVFEMGGGTYPAARASE